MPNPGRNELCHCGSGRKFKKCHALKTDEQRQSRMLMIVVGTVLVGGLAVGIASYAGTSSSSGVRIWSAEHGHYHNAAGVQVP